jgi:hypothetical protein
MESSTVTNSKEIIARLTKLATALNLDEREKFILEPWSSYLNWDGEYDLLHAWHKLEQEKQEEKLPVTRADLAAAVKEIRQLIEELRELKDVLE